MLVEIIKFRPLSAMSWRYSNYSVEKYIVLILLEILSAEESKMTENSDQSPYFPSAV